jgi:hypothetical protein
MDKLIMDGKVAVLISGGFGAGWSTWCGEEVLFDKDVALAVLGESDETPLEVAKRKFPDAYYGGVDGLRVEWVPKGQRFEINEYDGRESLHFLGPDDGYVA